MVCENNFQKYLHIMTTNYPPCLSALFPESDLEVLQNPVGSVCAQYHQQTGCGCDHEHRQIWLEAQDMAKIKNTCT